VKVLVAEKAIQVGGKRYPVGKPEGEGFVSPASGRFNDTGEKCGVFFHQNKD